MEVLSSALPNGLFDFSSYSSNSNSRFIDKSIRHRFNLPISKYPYHRISILRVSARFGETSRRRNSLRKKIIGDEHWRSSPKSSDSGTKPRNENHSIDHSDDLVELSTTEGLKDVVSQESNLLNELEDWVARYKKEAEYWGIGSNPIFMVYQDSFGKVEKVDVDEDEILNRRSGHEDLDSVSSKVIYAKKLAEQMKNWEDVIHKDSSVVKFVSSSSLSSSKKELQFVSSIQNAIGRLDLIPKLPAIGRAILCSYIGLWLLKTVIVHKSNKVVECTELEKEMMRRKMKAWKETKMMKKGTVEVLQEEGLEKPLVSFDKPKFDHKELMSTIYKVKGSEKKLELLNSSLVESDESSDINDKIHEIQAMARRARKIEAAIELDEKEKRNVNKEMGEDDGDISMRPKNSPPHEGLTHSEVNEKYESLGVSTESDQENSEVSGLDAPMVNGDALDSGCSDNEMAASHKEKVSNVVPLVPTGRTAQSSDVSKDKLTMMKNSTPRRSRVIRSVKEAKEFLATRSVGNELIQEQSQMTDHDSNVIFPKQSDEELGVARKNELVDKNKIPSASVNAFLKSTPESDSSEPLGKDVDPRPQKNAYQKVSEPGNAVKGPNKQRDSLNETEEPKRSLFKSAKSASGGSEHIEKEEPSGKDNWIEKATMKLSLFLKK